MDIEDMDFKELNHLRKNKKAKEFSKEIIEECKKREFTIADMKDLAKIVASDISKVIISAEQKVKLTTVLKEADGIDQDNEGIHL